MPEEKFEAYDRLILYLTAVGVAGLFLYVGLNISDRLKSIDDKLEKPKYELQVKNVIGHEAPEKFYEINGKRVYLEIDGKPVEQYFK